MAKPNQIFTKPWAWTRAEKDAPYPPATQALVGSGRTSIDKGFPDETMMAPAAGGIPPYGQDMNGILKSITENLCYYSAGGLFEYDANREYDAPAIVSYNGKIYRCVKANGPSNKVAPTANGDYWKHVLDESDVAPIYSDFSGMVSFFACGTPPSGNWLVCNGQEVSRSVYAGLFNRIKTTYGSGNGSTTFNLPNLLNRVAWGATSSVGTTIEAGLPNITGTFVGEAAGYYESTNSGAFYVDTAHGNRNQGIGDSDWDNYRTGFDASRSSAIYGRSTTVQPPAMRLLPCIHV